MTILSLLNDPTLTDTEWTALYRYFDFYGLLDEPDTEVVQVQDQVQVQQKKDDKLRPVKVTKTKWAPEKYKTSQKKQIRQRMRDYKILN